MASFKTLVSSLNRLSLNASKHQIGLYNFISQNGFCKRYLMNVSYPVNLLKLTLGVESRVKILNPVNIQKPSPPSLIALNQGRNFGLSAAVGASLQHMHERGPVIKRKPKKPLGGKPFAKGIVLRLLNKKPKKPNSAKRKCVLVRLSTGKEMVAYVPGEGHNLQEHHTVLVRVGRLRDVPGVHVKCVRGAYDLNHVVKKKQ